MRFSRSFDHFSLNIMVLYDDAAADSGGLFCGPGIIHVMSQSD